MKVIRPVAVKTIEYFHIFQRADGSGYSFPVTEDGVFEAKCDAAEKNYQLATSSLVPGLRDLGIEEREYFSTPSKYGICSCGQEVMLTGFTNTCNCGLDYNSSGELLAPRSQWGEETGESLSDILGIP